MILPLSPDRDKKIESRVIVMGKELGDNHFKDAARFASGTFQRHDDKSVTIFGEHEGASMVKVHYPSQSGVPLFIFPDGVGHDIDALILREGTTGSPASVTIVSFETYDNGADQRLTKITLTQGDSKIKKEDFDPSEPEILSPENQGVLRAILVSKRSPLRI